VELKELVRWYVGPQPILVFLKLRFAKALEDFTLKLVVLAHHIDSIHVASVYTEAPGEKEY